MSITTATPKGGVYPPGLVAQAQDAAVFERAGAGVYLTVEWIATYIQNAIGNGSAITFGTTNPANTVGTQDDIFFNVSTGEVLSKGATTWTVQANFALDTEVTAAITAHAGAADPHPIYLTQAEAAALFKPLTTDDSVATGLRFALKTTITGTPASGEVQFNNATLASVTSLLISETGRDGSSIPTLLDMLQQTTRIIIQVEQSEGLYAWFNINGAIVDNGTYRTVPVAFVTAPTGVTTVAGLGAAGAELTLDFYGAASGGGGGVASGLKFAYNSTTTLPAASKQFRANAATPNTATTLSFSATEDQTSDPSVAAILTRLKLNSIIEVRQSATCYFRYTCASDATLNTTVTPNAYDVTVSPLPGGPDAIAAGSVYLTILSDAPSTGGGGGGGRDLLTGNRTYFVSPSGSGAQDGSTAGNAFTPTQARTKLATVDLNGFNITLQFADGTYNNFNFILVPLVGAGKVFLRGNPTTPASCTLNGAGADVIATDSTFDTVYEIDGFTIGNTTGNCIYIQHPGLIRTRALRFTASSGVHIATESGGKVDVLTAYSIVGNASIHIYAVGTASQIRYSTLVPNPQTIQISAGLSIGTFAYCTNFGFLGLYGNGYVAFSTTSVTGKQYTVESNGIIQTAGAGGSYLPGNNPGTQTSQGQYL